MERSKKFDTKSLVGIAIFSALAYVVAYVCNIIPPVAGFLSLDVKDAVIAMASFVFGPIAAVVISFIAAFIEFVSFSVTGWYGFVMNFASSAVFSLTASLIYRSRKTLNLALIGFLSAVALTTGVMLLLNIFVTPFYLVQYMGMPMTVATATVRELLAKVLLPFNFAKSLLNSACAMLLYKPLTEALRRAHLIEGGKKIAFNKNTLIILVVGVAALATALVILLIIW
jgi:riboflavin transporter FmnP